MCLLHAYADGAHGDRLGALLHEALPGAYVALSHQVLPQIQEYEQSSTTVVDAYVGPVVARYLEEMEGAWPGWGSPPPCGDAVQRGQHEREGRPTKRRPGTADSKLRPARGGRGGGPGARGCRGVEPVGRAGGTAAAVAQQPARWAGALLALDMGGTTAKALLILDGALPWRAEAEIGGCDRYHAPLNGGAATPSASPRWTWWRSAPGAGACSGWTTGGIAGGPPERRGRARSRSATGRADRLHPDRRQRGAWLSQSAGSGRGAVPLDAESARRAVEPWGGAGDGDGGGSAGAYQVAVASMVRGGARRLRRAGPRPGRDDPRRLRRQPPARWRWWPRWASRGCWCLPPPASSAPGGSSRRASPTTPRARTCARCGRSRRGR